MAEINVMFWNLQDFGFRHEYRGFVGDGFTGFIAEAVFRAKIDILLIQEIRCCLPGSTSATSALPTLFVLHAALNSLPAPHNNWCLEFIKGGVRTWVDLPLAPGGGLPLLPFNLSEDLAWATPRKEGYAMFVNLNIAKFKLEQAAPIPVIDLPTPSGPMPFRAPAAVGGTMPAEHSEGMHYHRPGAVVISTLASNLTVPTGATPYSLPPGSWIPNVPGLTHLGAPVPIAGGTAALDPKGSGTAGVSLPPGVFLALPAQTVIPATSYIGPSPIGGPRSGVTISSGEVVIPSDYTLEDDVELPPAGICLLPRHSLSLCLLGRPSTRGPVVGGPYVPFTAAPPTAWNWLRLPKGFIHGILGNRRPAFTTIRLNPKCATATAAAGAPSASLIPIHVYHAPAAQFERKVGMMAAATAHSMYQVYDWNSASWVQPDRVLFGGDLNEPLDPSGWPYKSFTESFAAGGAGCMTATVPAAPGIRILNLLPPTPPSEVPANKTTVNLSDWSAGYPPPAVLDTNPDAYRIGAIDNIFFRGFSSAQSPMHPFGGMYDLLTALQSAGALGGPDFHFAKIHQLLSVYYQRQCGVAFPAPPPLPAPAVPPFSSVNDLNTLLSPLTGTFPAVLGVPPAAGSPGFLPRLNFVAGAPPTLPGVPNAARAAAEFVNLLVSDHLPVLFQMRM